MATGSYPVSPTVNGQYREFRLLSTGRKPAASLLGSGISGFERHFAIVVKYEGLGYETSFVNVATSP